MSLFSFGGQPAPVAALATQISIKTKNDEPVGCKTAKPQRLRNVKRPEEVKVGHRGEDLQQLSGRKTEVI